jgi:hypothetical protein
MYVVPPLDLMMRRHNEDIIAHCGLAASATALFPSGSIFNLYPELEVTMKEAIYREGPLREDLRCT